MAIPPSTALDILESETTLCDGEGNTCSAPDQETQNTSIDDYSSGDFVVLHHEMYCHNCDQIWANYIEYRA